MPRLFISIILIALALIVGAMFLWPHYQQLSNLQVQIENKDLEIQYEQEYYENLFSLSEELKRYPPELAKIDSALPSDSQLPNLLRLLQETSSENGVLLTGVTSFSTKALVEKPNLKEIESSLNLLGSYSALKNFLRALERSSRIIKIDNISFSASLAPLRPGPSPPPEPSKGETSEMFNFQLNIKTGSY